MPSTATATKPPEYKRGTIATHPDLPGVTIEPMWITPEMAQAWLLLNTENRHVKERWAAALTRILWEDLWIFDGHAILFAPDGTLIDGQHRLTAIVKSGKPAMSLVIKGLVTEVRKVVDSGKPRTVRDELAMARIKNSVLVAALGRYVYMYALTRDRVPASGSITPSTQEVLATIEAFQEEIFAAAAFAASAKAQIATNGLSNLVPSVAGYGYLAFWLATDKPTAHDFMQRMVSGVELKRDDPALVFRNRIMAHDGKPGKPKYNTAQQLCLLYMAWNAFQGGKTLDRLQLPTGKLTHRNFTEPVYLKAAELRKRMPPELIPSAPAEDELLRGVLL